MDIQLELAPPIVPNEEMDALRNWLVVRDWQTRRELATGLGWSERKIRLVAESLGAEIIRGQQGFKLTRLTGRADLPAAVQAADAAISQGKLMIKYGFALRKHLHQLVG